MNKNVLRNILSARCFSRLTADGHNIHNIKLNHTLGIILHDDQLASSGIYFKIHLETNV